MRTGNLSARPIEPAVATVCDDATSLAADPVPGLGPVPVGR